MRQYNLAPKLIISIHENNYQPFIFRNVTLNDGRFSKGSLTLLAALTNATLAFIFFSISSLSRFFSAAFELAFALPMILNPSIRYRVPEDSIKLFNLTLYIYSIGANIIRSNMFIGFKLKQAANHIIASKVSQLDSQL